jgi:microsomal epoxide hydrolase
MRSCSATTVLGQFSVACRARARKFLAACALALAWSTVAHAAVDRWFVTSDGVRLHYEEAGRGPTLVFVPGWTMPAWIWNAQIADFSRRYHVIAFDPRSQGESEIAATGHDPERRGEDIAELLAQFGRERVVLVGWSLGVLDTLAYIHSHGDDRIAGLVLVDNSVGEDPAPQPIRAPAIRRPRHTPVRPMTREEAMRAFVIGMFHHPQPPDFIERLTEACLRTPAPIAAALKAYPVPRTYWREAVYATDRPILYIVRPGLAGQAANLGAHDPQAETIVLNDVGHAMFVDEPGEFDSLLLSFLYRRVWRY